MGATTFASPGRAAVIPLNRDVRTPTSQAERRSYPRHSTLWANCTVSTIDGAEKGPLVDLSYGGMCFEMRTPVGVGETLDLRVDVQRLVAGVANVTARVCRVERIAPERFLVGAEFLTSDKAWLGPEQS